MNKMLVIFKKYFYQLVIVFIVGLVFLANYKSGAYLTGWDNLQTDLNPWLGIKRAFFAVWQEYQSFGLVGGMGHASDLIRSVFIWLISFVLPQSLIRYFFHFLMLLVGGLGMLKLLESVGFAEEKKVFAFLGSLFYILNLGTIQMFFLPFEPFSIFFAFLPWELWVFMKILRSAQDDNKEKLLLFFIINLLATPQAYVQTLFVVYILILGCISLGIFIEKPSFQFVKRTFLLFSIIFFINSFWIFPQLYFLKSGGGEIVKNAKVNQLATEDVYFQNLEKGNLKSFLKLEGFYFDRFGINRQPLFAAWKEHFSQPLFGFLPYVIGLIGLIGLIGGRNKIKLWGSFLLAYLLVAIGLLSATPPFSWLNNFLTQNEFIKQVFRSPFTKFIIPYSLIASYFFAVGLLVIYQKLLKRLTTFNFGLFVGLILVLYALPAFSGFYVSSEMRVAIPQEYFELMQYFKNQNKNQRIALLPDYTFWGWFFHKWGYNGSGFLWYGIEQPIVSRTFDVWSNRSESYFWEIKAAVEAQSVEQFEKILAKYNINYLVLDTSLIPVVSSVKGMQYDQIEHLLGSSKSIILVKKLNDISLYKVLASNSDMVYPLINIPNIGPKVKIVNADTAYFENGNYQVNNKALFDIYYPFLDLTSQTRIEAKNWKIREDQENFILESSLDIDSASYQLVLPPAENWTIFDDQNNLLEIPINLTATVADKKLVVLIAKTKVADFLPKYTNYTDCTQNTVCFGYESPDLQQRYSYLARLENSNTSGRNLFFFIVDQTKKQSYIEDRLKNIPEYYILPKKYDYGLGYSFNFQNQSITNVQSINRLTNLSVYLFPYEELKKIKFVRSGYTNEPQDKNKLLVFAQTFDPGWKAYEGSIFGRELKNHVLVNNWANGWQLDNDINLNNIIFVFWPQYLEFIGFGLLIVAFIFIVRFRYEN